MAGPQTAMMQFFHAAAQYAHNGVLLCSLFLDCSATSGHEMLPPEEFNNLQVATEGNDAVYNIDQLKDAPRAMPAGLGGGALPDPGPDAAAGGGTPARGAEDRASRSRHEAVPALSDGKDPMKSDTRFQNLPRYRRPGKQAILDEQRQCKADVWQGMLQTCSHEFGLRAYLTSHF